LVSSYSKVLLLQIVQLSASRGSLRVSLSSFRRHTAIPTTASVIASPMKIRTSHGGTGTSVDTPLPFFAAVFPTPGGLARLHHLSGALSFSLDQRMWGERSSKVYKPSSGNSTKPLQSPLTLPCPSGRPLPPCRTTTVPSVPTSTVAPPVAGEGGGGMSCTRAHAQCGEAEEFAAQSCL